MKLLRLFFFTASLLTRVISEGRNETNGRCRGVFYWEPQCLPGG